MGTDKLKPDDYRTSLIAFSIHSNTDTESEYRLAVREVEDGTPTASAIHNSSATIVRTLGQTAINVLMTFHMDTTFFDTDTMWEDPLDMALVDQALLQPNTDYSLYAVSEADKELADVHNLGVFTTDSPPSAADVSTSFLYGPVEHVYTVRLHEPFLLPCVAVKLISALYIETNLSKSNPDSFSPMTQISNAFQVAIPSHSLTQYFPVNLDNEILKAAIAEKEFLAGAVSNNSVLQTESFGFIWYDGGTNEAATINFLFQ